MSVRLVLVLLATLPASAGLASESASAAPGDGTLRVTVRGPQALSANISVRTSSGRVVVSKPSGAKAVKPKLVVKAGKLEVKAPRVTFDGSLFEARIKQSSSRIKRRQTTRVEVSYRELGVARRLNASAVAKDSITLSWDAPQRGPVKLRRALGSIAPATSKAGVAVPVKGAGAVDGGLAAGTKYSYSLFTKVGGRWIGPVAVTAGTASPDPTVAAYVAPPSTTILEPGAPDVVTPTGAGVTVQLAPARKTPLIGSGFVLPVSAALPGGFLGRVTSVSADGRTVNLIAGGLGDAFDYYDISVDLADTGPITLTPQSTTSGERAVRQQAALVSCLGGSIAGSINIKPIIKPKGHFGGSFIKGWMGVPTGAKFDLSIELEVGVAIDAEIRAALECGLPFERVFKPLALTPVPISLVFEPSAKVSISGALKVEDLGYSVTGGFWTRGELGVSTQRAEGGLIARGGPTRMNQTASAELGLSLGGELTVGPGGGSSSGVIAGVGGQFYPLKVGAGTVFPLNDARRSACFKASAGGEAQLDVNAKAWMGNWSVSQAVTLDALKGSLSYGGPWYYPTNCEKLPELPPVVTPTPVVTPAPVPGMVRASVSWDSEADIDLHIWDPRGNHASFRDETAIPNARLIEDIIPGYGPEQFETFEGKGDRYTFGICEYNDRDADTTTVTVDITDPDGTKRRFSEELYFEEDAWMVTVSPDGVAFRPRRGWCDTSAYSEDPTLIGNTTFDE